MITITRRLAAEVRSVFRRAMNLSSRGPLPAVSMKAGPDGLRIQAKVHETAIEYLLPGQYLSERLWLSFQALMDCEGSRPDPVELRATDAGRIEVCWRDGQVPQIVVYDPVEPEAGDFPVLPERFVENPPALLKALHDASQTTDPESARYALGSIQLRGQYGSLLATDGRQLLVQSGFEFPWQEDLLIPGSKVYAGRELSFDQPVAIGRTEDWVTVRTGPWTLWHRIDQEGGFPDVERQVPDARGAMARLMISPDDAMFLAESLPRLPGDQEFNYPVTVDLNGLVAIRAKTEGQPRSTELILTGSTSTGGPLRFTTNRKFLARALALGFHEISIFSPKSPVLGQDETRRYVWALLDPESAIGPSDDALRIESPPCTSKPAPLTTLRRTSSTMSGANSHSGENRRNGRHIGAEEETPPSALSVIEQAVALRSALQEAAGQAGQLVRLLKQDKRQARQLRTVLDSLRQLQTLPP